MNPIETTVTFLEMRARPERRAQAPLKPRATLMRAEAPPVHFYRDLYELVGKPWIWVNRRRMNDHDIAAAIHDPGVRIYVLYADGSPAGFAEFDMRKPHDIELTYFGLAPDFIGRGLGGFFLEQALSIAWDKAPRRVHVQTCTLDHPRALGLYQRSGFTPFRQEQAYVTPIGDEPHPLVRAQIEGAA